MRVFRMSEWGLPTKAYRWVTICSGHLNKLITHCCRLQTFYGTRDSVNHRWKVVLVLKVKFLSLKNETKRRASDRQGKKRRTK